MRKVHSDNVIVGRVIDAFGIRGQVKVRSFTEDTENLLNFSCWILRRKVDSCQPYRVFKAQLHGNLITAELEGIVTRDQALMLKGSDILIPESDFPKLPDGEYYHFQLLGLRVVDIDGTDYGCIADIMQTGANDVLVVKSPKIRLIPYTAQVVKKVDLKDGVVQVLWYADF